ncbi:MAG: serine/threonine protein kinase, partial [Deltaproteobacteria bacterium]|nr:serine/threonine protein kinase [Deltaproteobacteria bacterium]
MFPARVTQPTLGRYDVLAFVGEGGMGTVYAAHDPRLERKVAIKLLRGTSNDPRQRARLAREAKTLARLSHPNIVTIHEVWDEGGELYIAMEFVEGQDLSGWQRGEQRSWQQVLDVYLQAGRGLAAVHEAGLVYRDFKPA